MMTACWPSLILDQKVLVDISLTADLPIPGKVRSRYIADVPSLETTMLP